MDLNEAPASVPASLGAEPLGLATNSGDMKAAGPNTNHTRDENEAEDDRGYISSEEESEADVIRQTIDSRWRRDIYSLGRKEEPLAERVKRSKRRMNQAKAYTQLLEDRISYLENAVRKLSGQEEQPNTQSNDDEVVPSELKVQVFSWADFHPPLNMLANLSTTWRHRPELESGKKFVIELLMDEPIFSHVAHLRRTYALGYPFPDARSGLGGLLNASTQNSKQSEGAPYRIRIRSRLLLRLLQRITGHNTMVGPHKHRILFFQPFKLLVSYATAIKQYVDNNRQIPNPTQATNPRDLLKGPLEEIETPEALKQLEMLYGIIDQYLKPMTDISRGCVEPDDKVAFKNLWHLFKVGTQVRTSRENRIQLYRVLSVTGGRPPLSISPQPPGGRVISDRTPANHLKNEGYSIGSFVITCLWIDFDGQCFIPVYTHIIIPSYSDEKPITTLEVYPIHYDPRKSDTINMLKARGEKFRRLCDPKRPVHKSYKGMTLDRRPEKVESKVMIDFQLYFSEMPETRPKVVPRTSVLDDDRHELNDSMLGHPSCASGGCCSNDYIHWDYEVDERQRDRFRNNQKPLFETYKSHQSLPDDVVVLLSPRVFGFVLRSRRWATFDIDLVNERETDDNQSPWERLVVDDKIKDTVLALVKNHEQPRDPQIKRTDSGLASVDLIQSKGRGLIILLHGEPGVGKTSTAECVAEYTRRPLFPITCGDIGDNAKSVETNLEKNFQLAHKWGCVLLLDEADIFLSKRTSNDIKRNAIVSVFLRTLEYYSGILFLTTNRVGNIDRAFKSRIHLSLYYPSLDKERTLKIWQNNLDLLRKEFQKEGKQSDFMDKQILQFADRHFDALEEANLLVWNGRQIRNAFQTAVAIANYESKEDTIMVLSAHQFKQVARIACEFDKYLQDIYRGKNDAQLARDSGSRFDDVLQSESSNARAAPFVLPRGRGGGVAGGQGSRKRHRANVNVFSDDDDAFSDVFGDEDDSVGFERQTKTTNRSKRHRGDGY